MDDGDIMCHPIWGLPFLQDFDVANARVGAERNSLKTENIQCVNDLDAAPPELKIGDVRAMHERVQLCQDPKTEFSILRKSLGVSRINHIQRVHGNTILEERSAAAVDHEIWATVPRTALP